MVGEITPNYALCSEMVFAEMAALAPNVRFVFIMRDPVSRLWSSCRHQLRAQIGLESATKNAVADRLLEGLDNPSDVLIKLSRYDKTIETLESVIESEKIAYFFYETMFQEPEVKRLCDFLCITRSVADFNRRVNAKDDAAGEIPTEIARKARQALAPTYDYCKTKFSSLPREWNDETIRGGE